MKRDLSSMEKPENTHNSITFVVSTEERIRTARYRGVVDDRLLLDAYSRLITDCNFDPTLDDIVDLRDVSSFEITNNGLRRLVGMLAELDRFGFRTKVAIVAKDDVTFGMGRMYEIMRGMAANSTEDIYIFREYDEALRWLCDSRVEQRT